MTSDGRDVYVSNIGDATYSDIVPKTREATVDATLFRIDPETNRIAARIALRADVVDGLVVSDGFVWVAVPESR